MNEDDLAKALALAGASDPYIVCWRDLDPQSTTEELERLAEWVAWVIHRYRVDHKTIPPCWPEHGALVEELSALRTYWESCYQDDANPADPLAFHRDLTLTLRRLRDWSSLLGCTRTTHRPELVS
ncbi:hypothetical protein EV646_116119 [Kribbella antiqua]|uniref:Uncharacterized protein n=1 Tax=Kribbella antiqua TaxID=2512217 RepID=A0A4R2IC32_9ACTN|nr:hypothetical protein [Kribbella antiqua]TCO41028.1 hypothetical protein EV646_116119 [Kribbella antiqua]